MLRAGPVLSIAILAACDTPGARAPVAAPKCELPGEPEIIKRDGASVLERWDLVDAPVWQGETLPDAPGYAAFRGAIRDAGGDLPRPRQDPPQPKDDVERELWAREDANAALVYDGGMVRPIRCLEAALFARQDARYSELTHPTEFVASILRRDGRLRIYVGSSDQMFPRGAFYGLDEARADAARGWDYWAALHNHTVVTHEGKPALGTPAPSTNDVHLLRGLVEDAGLREAWVTNGMYTGVVPGPALAGFHGPLEPPP